MTTKSYNCCNWFLFWNTSVAGVYICIVFDLIEFGLFLKTINFSWIVFWNQYLTKKLNSIVKDKVSRWITYQKKRKEPWRKWRERFFTQWKRTKMGWICYIDTGNEYMQTYLEIFNGFSCFVFIITNSFAWSHRCINFF